MTDYQPDAYRLILLDNKLIKVFGNWYGSYLDGDAWRVNSGCTRIEEHDDYYKVFGYSGSIYYLNKPLNPLDKYTQGKLTAYGSMKYNQILNTLKEGGVDVKEISVEKAIKFLEEDK